MRWRGVVALFATAFVPAAAWAGQANDDEQPSAPARPSPTVADPVPPGPVPEWIPPKLRATAIYWIVGLGAPLGIGGFEGVHHFWSTPFELAVGVGNGLSAIASRKDASLAQTFQWAVMPRVRLGNEADTLTLGVGVSGGQYGDIPFGDGPIDTFSTKYFLWGNFEIGGEHWSRSGFAIRYFLGIASGCAVASCEKADRRVLPYLGLGLGYAW